MANMDLPRQAVDYLTIAQFAERVGAHPNTVRKIVRSGDIPYLVEDTLSGDLLSPEAPRPVRFRYLLDPVGIQHVVANLNPPVRSPSKAAMSPPLPATTVTLHETTEELNKLRRDVAMLGAQNELLQQHNAFLQGLTDRLIPLLPPASDTATTEAVRRRWWQFWLQRSKGGTDEGSDQQI